MFDDREKYKVTPDQRDYINAVLAPDSGWAKEPAFYEEGHLWYYPKFSKLVHSVDISDDTVQAWKLSLEKKVIDADTSKTIVVDYPEWKQLNIMSDAMAAILLPVEERTESDNNRIDAFLEMRKAIVGLRESGDQKLQEADNG